MKTKQQAHIAGIIALLFSSCANIVPPAGGAKDEQPPHIMQSVPQNLSTRFRGSKISITFDEYIKLENASQEVVISPAIEPAPRFHVKGKKLEIDLKGSALDSSATYTINFGSAIKDVNESNALSGFRYVFSTGEKLDSLFISGKVMEAAAGKPASKIVVMLHRHLNDSALLSKKPFYFTKTDEGGNFRIDNIRNGIYRLYALRDNNFNYTYDLPGEEIAFLDTAIAVSENLSSLRLDLFSEEREIPLKRLALDDKRKGFIRLIYSRGIDEIEIKSADDGFSVALPEYNPAKDTITAWYTRAVKGDMLKLIVNEDSVENVFARNIPHQEDTLKELFSTFRLARKDSLIATEGWISATLNQPVLAGKLENVIVLADSINTTVSSKIKFADGGKRTVLLDFKRLPETGYNIVFPAGTFVNYTGTANDTLRWMVRTKSEEDYGSIKLTVSGQPGQIYVMQILGKDEKPVKESTFTGSAAFEFDKMMPGSYKIRIIYDSNNNGKWDTGNFLKHLQPERTYFHPEKINIRANWDLETELRLSE